MRTNKWVILCAVLFFSASLFAQISFEIEGKGFSIQNMRNGAQALTDRKYVWTSVPSRFNGWQFTQVGAIARAEMAVRSAMDGVLYIATGTKDADLSGWAREPSLSFDYSPAGATRMYVYKTSYRGGTVVKIPQVSGLRTIVLAPKLVHAVDGFGKPMPASGKSAATPQSRLTTTIKTRYEQTVLFARQQYLRDLDAAQRAAMQVNDLEEANVIRAAIQEAANGNVTPRSFKNRLANAAGARYAQAAESAKRQYLVDLDAAYKSAMAAGNLDEANEIVAIRKQLGEK